MATKLQIVLVAAVALLAMVQLISTQGTSYTQLNNGHGWKYDYGIQHDHHGHAHGSSYPHGYGGFGAPAAGGAGGVAGGF